MKVRDSNGELKKVVLQANDSIPAGTIVDFDGDVVPEGYEKVEEEQKKIPYVTLATNNIKYRKINDIVEIIIQIQKEVALEKGVWKELGQLPEGFRPVQAELIYPIYIWGNFGEYTDKCGKLSILQNGIIRVSLISAGGKAQNIMTVINFSTIPEN